MEKTKFKYNQNTVQFWVLQVAFIFSVFAFSGFNENIQDSLQESNTTELVESRSFQADLGLNTFTSNHLAIPLAGVQFDVKPYDSYTLLHFKKTIAVQYKAILQKNLSYSFSSMKLLFKIVRSSSLDEYPSPFIK